MHYDSIHSDFLLPIPPTPQSPSCPSPIFLLPSSLLYLSHWVCWCCSLTYDCRSTPWSRGSQQAPFLKRTDSPFHSSPQLSGLLR